VGYPYTWAGKSPSTGFDCSGFTYWVFLNVRGINIGGGTDSQAALGTAVAWGEWQPGDLIFFRGTGGTGGFYSHVGIYVGNGQMVHAANPSAGVIVSDLYSTYYTSHYALAKRL
jgi:cell wall-associated NlpC family hydrolase